MQGMVWWWMFGVPAAAVLLIYFARLMGSV